MAQRATGFSKKKLEVVKSTFANDTAPAAEPLGPVAEPIPAAIRTLPLELASLLTPYRRHGRLSLRVERVPQLARLSGGRNNGDGTWSLASDELEGLAYLAPEDLKEHALTIRIMAFDGSAAFTLKVLDLPISADISVPTAMPQKEALARSAPDNEGAAELRRLQDALAEARTALAFRETELAESRQESEQARREAAGKDAELAAARSVWQAGMEDRLAAVTAQVAGEIERARKTWQAEQDVRAATLESHAERRLVEARELWQKESQTVAAKAEKNARAKEAERLAAAEAAWREQSARALAEATRRCETLEASLAAERARADAAPSATETERALGRLHGELAAARKSLAERDNALAQSQAEHRQALERARQDHQGGVLDAEKRWKAEEAARLAAAEAGWREQSARAFAEVAQRCAALENDLAKAWARPDPAPALAEAQARWKAEEAARLATAEAAWREQSARPLAEMAQRCAALENDLAKERARPDVAPALAEAQARWKAEEAARFAAAETVWREQSTRPLTEMTQRCAALESDLAKEKARPDLAPALEARDRELDGLRGELAAMRTALGGREGELAQQRKESQAALDSAKAAWQAGEAARLATAEAQWRARSEAEQALAKARCETAERALLEAVANAAQARAGGAERPDKELAPLQTMLKDRERDLEQLRQDLEQARARARQEQEAALANARTAWQSEQAAQLAAAETRGQEQAAATLANATARAEIAEAALNKARNRSPERGGDDTYVERLRRELAMTQATLVDREAELVHARSTLEQARARQWPDNNLVVGGYDERDGRAGSGSHLLRDAIVVMAVVMAAILFWPRLEIYLPDEWRYQIDTLTSGLPVAVRQAPAPAPAAAPQPQPATQPETATVTKAVNMRADASVAGDVVLTLPRGVGVVVLERRGNWTRVGYDAVDGTGQKQGWVFNTYLKAADPAAAKPSPGDSLRP